MSATTPQGTAENRAALKQHFDQFKGDAYLEGWDALWAKGDFLPWDRGSPSPALSDTLLHHADTLGNALVQPQAGGDDDGKARRKRALVPGCGRGVDVLLLRSFGYDVVGLEYSPGAIRACEEYAAQSADKYPVHDETVGAGSFKFVQGDFYADEWLESAGLQKDAKFDLIYDYTFFCAMTPDMRPAWAKRMSELLRDSSQANLVCLEFPVSKPAKSGGPPFGVPPKTYVEHLSHPGEKIPYDAEGYVKSDPLAPIGPGGLEKVGHWHPADTHKVGKDKDGNVEDYISVWRHR